jgi:hypothetical protein
MVPKPKSGPDDQPLGAKLHASVVRDHKDAALPVRKVRYAIERLP